MLYCYSLTDYCTGIKLLALSYKIVFIYLFIIIFSNPFISILIIVLFIYLLYMHTYYISTYIYVGLRSRVGP